jgi:hypothetical protein
MRLYQALVQADEAWAFANLLGRFGAAHVLDLNSEEYLPKGEQPPLERRYSR